MYYNETTSRYLLIGTVNGGGYDCRTDTEGLFEGSNNVVCNKVSAHMEWIQETMGELGETLCEPYHSQEMEYIDETEEMVVEPVKNGTVEDYVQDKEIDKQKETVVEPRCYEWGC